MNRGNRSLKEIHQRKCGQSRISKGNKYDANAGSRPGDDQKMISQKNYIVTKTDKSDR